MTKKKQASHSRNHFAAILRSQQQIAFQHVLCRIAAGTRLIKSVAFKFTKKAPQMCLVDVGNGSADGWHVFKPDRTRFIEQRREFLARGLAFFRTNAQVKPAITSAIRTAF